VYFDGRPPFKKEAATELIKRIQSFGASKISPQAVKVAEAAQNKVEQLLREGGKPLRTISIDSSRYPVSAYNATLFPPALPRPKRLAPVTIEGSVVDSSGHPVEGATVSARGRNPGASTSADGRFVLQHVDANMPLFLRVSKTGHVSTNTAYLNPRSPKANVRILLLTNQELQDVTRAWSGSKDAASEHSAVLLLNTIGANGKPISGLKLTTSPAGATRFGFPDKRGPVQIVGITNINFQPSFPAQSNDHEPNVIVTVNPLAKDIVMPAFTGQVSYAVILATPSGEQD
jgi:hypothetical protein